MHMYEICRTCIMQQEHTSAGYKVRLVIKGVQSCNIHFVE